MYSYRGEAQPASNLDDLIYKPPCNHYTLNLWNFKDDNSRKFNPYIIKPSRETISEFEKSIKIGKVAKFRDPPKNRLSSSCI